MGGSRRLTGGQVENMGDQCRKDQGQREASSEARDPTSGHLVGRLVTLMAKSRSEPGLLGLCTGTTGWATGNQAELYKGQ